MLWLHFQRQKRKLETLEKKPNFPGEADRILEKNHLIWREKWNVLFQLGFLPATKNKQKKGKQKELERAE